MERNMEHQMGTGLLKRLVKKNDDVLIKASIITNVMLRSIAIALVMI